jgi:hypothetical protein
MKPASSLMIIPMAASDIVALGLSIGFTGLTNTIGIPWAGYAWNEMHGFIIPYVLTAAVASVLSIMAIASRRWRAQLSYTQPL